MSGIFFCDKLSMKVDENNNIPDSKRLYGVNPYKVPKVYLAGLGNVDCGRDDNWSNDSVVLVQDEGIIEYTQSSTEGYMVTEYEAYAAGRPCAYEVNLKMLETMA